MSTNIQLQPSRRPTSLLDCSLLAGTQIHEQEEEYYEEQAGREGYAEEEWQTQEEGASEEEPTPVWEPVGPDEREVSPSRAELRQRGATPTQDVASTQDWTVHVDQQSGQQRESA